jgi:3-oxoacyl-[acyl-carrier protein] reductase
MSLKNQQHVSELGFADIHQGDVFELDHAFTQEDVWRFADLSGDHSPLHVDPEYASGTEFGGCVVHGMLLASLFSNLVGMRIPGKHALYLGQDLTFRQPVLVGQSVHVSAKVMSKAEATRSIALATEIRTASGKLAVSGTAKVKVRDGSLAPSTIAQVEPQAGRGSKTRVALVTGGSGGIGAEIARTLAARGISVAVNYLHSESRALDVVARIRESGGSAIAVKADVREAEDLSSALALVVAELGEPTIVVNAATGPLEQKAFSDLAWTDYQRHLEYQVKAVVEVARAVYPFMKNAGGGSLVNLLSQVTANAPVPRMADYVTAKYALLGLSKALAVEWADDHIRVNMVSPGLVQTELTQHYHDRVFKMEAARTPLKRLATPEDVARSVAFLVSDEASYLTGVNLFVTGGQVML